MKPSRYNHLFQWKDRLFVVYNAASGAVVSLDPSAWRALSVGRVSDLAPSAHTLLADQGMLVADGTDERAAAMARYHRSRSSRNHLSLTIAPTMDCNFACPYCYEQRVPGMMAPEVQDQVIAFVADRLAHSKSMSVTWYGGEPLLATDTVLALTRRIRAVAEARDKEWSCSVVTNGYRLDSATAAALADAGISEVQITLDGSPAVHDARRRLRDGGGTFKRIVANLHHAVHAFQTVSLRINLDRDNADAWRDVQARLESEGLLEKLTVHLGKVDAISEVNADYRCACLDGDGFADQWVAWALDSRRRGVNAATLPKMTVCTAISDWSYVIGPTGHVYRCWNNPAEPASAVGHVNDPAALDTRTDWRDFDPTAWPECRDCNLLPACMGGCPDMLRRLGPGHACNRLKHCLREAVILHTLHKLEGGSHDQGKTG